MSTKDIIKEIVNNFQYSFYTQSVINELTTRKVKASKSYVTKILKELGYVFETHHKSWMKADQIENQNNELPETVKVFTPILTTYLFNSKENKLENSKTHFLGVFYKKEDAEAHLKLQIDFYAQVAKTITDKNPDIKFNISININEIEAHKSKKGFVFATEYRGE